MKHKVIPIIAVALLLAGCVKKTKTYPKATGEIIKVDSCKTCQPLVHAKVGKKVYKMTFWDDGGNLSLCLISKEAKVGMLITFPLEQWKEVEKKPFGSKRKQLWTDYFDDQLMGKVPTSQVTLKEKPKKKR